MAAPRYSAKKVGDDYVMVRTDTPLGCRQPNSILLGGLLISCGLARRGLLGYAAALAGGGFAYYGFTGKNPLQALGLIGGTELDSGPTFAHDAEKPAEQKPIDAVDEASMESFPASDPPAKMSPAVPAP